MPTNVARAFLGITLHRDDKGTLVRHVGSRYGARKMTSFWCRRVLLAAVAAEKAQRRDAVSILSKVTQEATA